MRPRLLIAEDNDSLQDRRDAPERQVELADGATDDPSTRVLYGLSPAMQQVFKAIGRAARGPHSVLITGESGTGKELVARILHASSDRAAGPLVTVNTAAIPGDLLEAELFGHTRGSFTGAHADRRGRFDEAHGGTLFLDEVGEMPLGLQAKLLRAIETRRFHPVGSARERQVDVRIVTSTHRDLAEAARAGRFRSDLYYRLNVLAIHLPPLRERLEDLPRLADWLLARHARENGLQCCSLDASAVDWLSSYTWPGNVRELENTLIRAAVFTGRTVLRTDDLRQAMGRGDHAEGGATGPSFEETLRHHLAPLVRRFPPPPEGSRSDLYDLVLRTTEQVLLRLTLERTEGNQLHASRLLGINRNTLKRKLDEQGVETSSLRRRKGRT